MRGRKKTGWDNLNTQGHSPLLRVTVCKASVGSIRHPRGDKCSSSKHELLKRCYTTSNIRTAEFSLLGRNDHDQSSYTQARDDYVSGQLRHRQRQTIDVRLPA